MNKLKMVIALMLLVASFTIVNAQVKKGQTETFKVWGNCGMCESTIEKALKIKGVSKADWNKDTKMIMVVFNPKKITLADIHKKLASVGYDTELETAPKEVYDNLHGCCQYERKNQ